jgi:hypothetical protein
MNQLTKGVEQMKIDIHEAIFNMNADELESIMASVKFEKKSITLQISPLIESRTEGVIPRQRRYHGEGYC